MLRCQESRLVGSPALAGWNSFNVICSVATPKLWLFRRRDHIAELSLFCRPHLLLLLLLPNSCGSHSSCDVVCFLSEWCASKHSGDVWFDCCASAPSSWQHRIICDKERARKVLSLTSVNCGSRHRCLACSGKQPRQNLWWSHWRLFSAFSCRNHAEQTSVQVLKN